MADKYLSLRYFKENRDHSSRVIHGKHDAPPHEVFVKPNHLLFGAVPMKGFSTIQKVVVRNVGYRDLTIKGIRHSGPYFVSHPAPSVLAPRESFEISVALNPVVTGMQVGFLYVDTDKAKGEVFVKLDGYGTDEVATIPHMTISDAVIESDYQFLLEHSPEHMDFGKTVIDGDGE